MRYRIALAQLGLGDPISLNESDARDFALDLSRREREALIGLWTSDGQRLVAVYYDGRTLWEAGGLLDQLLEANERLRRELQGGKGL